MQKRIIFGTLIIIWMIIIFLFSSQDGMESESTSDIITNRLVEENIDNSVSNTEENNIENNDQNIQNTYEYEMYKGEVRLFVRKSAHFFIYLVGGILIFNFLKTYNISLKKQIILTLLFAMIYASSDEFHQLFVDGRTARIFDVLLDTLGSTVGILLNMICLKICNVIKQNKEKINNLETNN